VLTRIATNQYFLSYKDANDVVKELSATSLETLLAAMRRNTADFSQTSIDQVRAQAALIPAVRLSRQSLDDIKVILTSFYTSPNAGTYNAVKEVYALYTGARLTTGEAIFEKIRFGYVAALTALNEGLARKVITDAETTRYFLGANEYYYAGSIFADNGDLFFDNLKLSENSDYNCLSGKELANSLPDKLKSMEYNIGIFAAQFRPFI
jgi:hypothetical protein